MQVGRVPSLAFAVPPGVHADPEVEAPASLEVVDGYQAPSHGVLGAAVLGALSLAGMAVSSAQAAEPPPPVSTRVESDTTSTRVDASFVNDSLRDVGGLVPNRYLRPGTKDGDDNGWTAEFRVDLTRTTGDDQTVSSGRFMMVTERGSWDPGPDYGGRRTDVVELAHQWNFRQPLGEKTEWYYGVGGGVQLVGPLGGRQLQEFVHENGYRGGRIGPESGLQYNYTSDSPSLAPLLTGGVGIRHSLTKSVDLTSSLMATLPLGPGIGGVVGQAGVEWQPTSRLGVGGGATLTGVYTNGDALDFIEADGVRPGGYAQVEYRLTDHITPFARLDTGGIRDEPVYRVGVSITFGGERAERPWLNPLWK